MPNTKILNAMDTQMTMFLIRLGLGGATVEADDPTESDLPETAGSRLGHTLGHTQRILARVRGVSIGTFTARGAVRHPLGVRIIEADGRDDARRPGAR